MAHHFNLAHLQVVRAQLAQQLGELATTFLTDILVSRLAEAEQHIAGKRVAMHFRLLHVFT
ncbi:hypothetical protein D3C71_2153490 [compost metagenome]